LFDFQRINPQPGDPLRASDIKAIVEELKRPTIEARAGSGLMIRRGLKGLQIAATTQAGFVAVAAADIAPRSGSTAGLGVVFRVHLDAATGLMTTTTDLLSVNNASAETVDGVASIQGGTYCWVEADRDGNLWVTPLECSNMPA
jgi:hypothetical protein